MSRKEDLKRGIRTAKRLGIRTQADMTARERDADTWIAVLLHEDISALLPCACKGDGCSWCES